MAKRNQSRRRQRLALTRDLYKRRKIMLKKYGQQQLKQLADQYGFDGINHPEFINLLVPANSDEGLLDIMEEEGGDEESPDKIKRKNQSPQDLISHPDEIQFDKTGTSIGGLKFDNIRASMYRELLKENNAERDMEHPKMIIPEPTDEERSAGFMFRYFLQQANSPSAPIIEVDKDQYEGWLKVGGGIDRTFYNGCLVKWRIRGNLQTTIGDDGIRRKGVLEGNTDSVELASEKLPALKNQITNLVKYWER